MTKKGRQFFFQEKRATPSVAGPGDTNPSDATDYKLPYYSERDRRIAITVQSACRLHFTPAP